MRKLEIEIYGEGEKVIGADEKLYRNCDDIENFELTFDFSQSEDYLRQKSELKTLESEQGFVKKLKEKWYST